MTEQGWREAIQKAFGDPELETLIGKLLTEQDAAKNTLREAGFGCIGSPWLNVVKEITERIAELENRLAMTQDAMQYDE